MIGEIEYYEHPGDDYRNEYRLGNIFNAPIIYPLKKGFHYLKLDYHDKEKPHNSNYTIEVSDIDSFNPEELAPLYEINLSRGEFILCNVYKFRQVILISNSMPDWRDYQKRFSEFYFVVPLYSTKDVSGNYRFSEEFLLRVQAYQYPTLFYLPEDLAFGIHESIARFDRMIAYDKDLLKPRPIRLTNDACSCITNWLNYFLGAELDEIISIYSKMAMEQVENN